MPEGCWAKITIYWASIWPSNNYWLLHEAHLHEALWMLAEKHGRNIWLSPSFIMNPNEPKPLGPKSPRTEVFVGINLPVPFKIYCLRIRCFVIAMIPTCLEKFDGDFFLNAVRYFQYCLISVKMCRSALEWHIGQNLIVWLIILNGLIFPPTELTWTGYNSFFPVYCLARV